jgi:uncharacterized protein (DUF2267 family)
VSELAFIERVADATETTDDVAEALVEGTLRTLARRISGGQAEDLAQRVPLRLRPFVFKIRENAEVFSYREFIDRVAEYADVDDATAERGVAAVMRALGDEVGAKQLSDTLAQLPKEFAQLTGRR